LSPPMRLESWGTTAVRTAMDRDIHMAAMKVTGAPSK
jgi:hypothetical protein